MKKAASKGCDAVEPDNISVSRRADEHDSNTHPARARSLFIYMPLSLPPPPSPLPLSLRTSFGTGPLCQEECYLLCLATSTAAVETASVRDCAEDMWLQENSKSVLTAKL